MYEANHFGFGVVIAMVKKGFYFIATSADEKRSESLEPEGNVCTLLVDRCAMIERDSARMHVVANV